MLVTKCKVEMLDNSSGGGGSSRGAGSEAGAEHQGGRQHPSRPGPIEAVQTCAPLFTRPPQGGPYNAAAAAIAAGAPV